MVDPTSAEPSRLGPVPPVHVADRDRLGAPLPAPLTSLVGREREVADVVGMVRDEGVRLLTLTGPGGVGKTRLAIEVATAVADAFPDGVRFVGLAPVPDPDLVVPAIAQLLGVREADNQPLAARVGAFLRDKRVLLVLDNAEQVVEAAPAVADLLGACPHLTVLVTSRVRLRLSGEHEYAVPPLGTAGQDGRASPEDVAGAAAVRLFVARARAAKSDFALTAENAPAVAAICRRLDGLPLAIELAAARVKVLPPPALLARLERRLPLLTGGGRDLPARQRTMRDAIAWSHDLLSEEEQVLFRRLSVFAGGFALEAAAAVVGEPDAPGLDVLDGVASLVDESLLRQEQGLGGEPRYRMLETVREFALERLAAGGEAAAVRTRQATWCLDFAERFGEGMAEMLEDLTWLRRAEAEHDNLRAALAWLERVGDGEGMLRLAGAIGPLWAIHSHRTEGIGWLERALALGRGAPAAARLRALAELGELLERQGHAERARARHEEQLALARDLGDPLQTVRALNMLGAVATNQGRYDEATPLVEEAQALAQRLGASFVENCCGYLLGIIAYGQDDIAAASARVEPVLAHWRAWGQTTVMTAIALNAAALLSCEQGDDARAAVLLAEALPLWQQFGEKEGQTEWLAAVARLVACRGRGDRAARLYGAAEASGDALGSPLVVPPPSVHRRHLAELRAALGAEAFAAAWAEGRALPPEQAVAEALAVTSGLPSAEAPGTPVDGTRGVPLTAREREVLRLVAEGLSDREIAERLCLSYRTVTSYVRDILTKLDLPSRTAAAAFAVRRGLA